MNISFSLKPEGLYTRSHRQEGIAIPKLLHRHFINIAFPSNLSISGLRKAMAVKGTGSSEEIFMSDLFVSHLGSTQQSRVLTQSF